MAVGPGIDIAGGEFLLDFCVGDPIPDVAQLEFFLAYKLMAGVQVAPGGHGHVFRSAAAAGDALVDAGAAGEVDHIVVEGKGPALFVALQLELGQVLILLHEDGQVLLRQARGVSLGGDHRFHGELRKAQVQHGLDVLQEVRVMVGKGAPHIVVLTVTLADQLLELRDDLVVAAVACVVHPEPVVDLLPAVQAQDNIAHFLIAEVDDILVNKHAVGGQGESEVLPRLLLDAAGIGHHLLDHIIAVDIGFRQRYTHRADVFLFAKLHTVTA